MGKPLHCDHAVPLLEPLIPPSIEPWRNGSPAPAKQDILNDSLSSLFDDGDACRAWDAISGLEPQQRSVLLKLASGGVLWKHPTKAASCVFTLHHGGDVEADGNCLFSAVKRAMALQHSPQEIRRKAVQRFLHDFEENILPKPATDLLIRNLYSPDLATGWGVHVVQEVKLLARKSERAAVEKAIQDLVHCGVSREEAAATVYKERCLRVDNGRAWADYMSIAGGSSDLYDIITLLYAQEGLISIDENHDGHTAAFGDDIAIECLASDFHREIFVAHGADAMVDVEHCVFFLQHRPHGEVLHYPVFLFMKGTGVSFVVHLSAKDSAPLLSEEAELQGNNVRVSFNPAGVLRWYGSTVGSIVLQDDLLGYERSGACTIVLRTFQLQEIQCCGENCHRVRKDLLFKVSSPEALDSWLRTIRDCLSLAERPQKLLIFLNPFSGRKLAKRIFQNEAEPLLDAAGIKYTLKETEYGKHANEMVKSIDLTGYDGIICASGDGVLVEVVNGLLGRPDWEEVIKIPLGVIPAGTGNGMAKSVLDHGNEHCSVANATFAIIRGNKQPLDVATIVQGQTHFHSVLLLTWGLIADIDFESERLRSLGNLRNDIYALIRILALRKYYGSIAYVPAPGYEGSGEFLDNKHEHLIQQIIEAETKCGSVSNKIGYQGPHFTFESTEWRFMQGNFVLVWVQNVPWASETVCAAPSALLSDGFLDLIIVKECPWWNLLPLLLKLSDGSYIRSKHVEYLKVKAFQLAPGGRVQSKVQGGFIDVDGEVLARGEGAYGDGSNDLMSYGLALQMTVKKGLLKIFCAHKLGVNYSG